MRTRTGTLLATLAAAAVLALGGCAVAPAPTPLERDYGLAHRLAIFGQTLNPDAERNPEPVEGVSGTAALGAQKKYENSFGARETNPTYTVPGTSVTLQVQEKTLTDKPAKAGK